MADPDSPDAPAPPDDLGDSGRRLWSEVVAAFELDEHETALLVQICRTVDVIDDLHDLVRADGYMVTSPQGATKAHPALVEARAQRITLARLQAALRLPSGEDG